MVQVINNEVVKQEIPTTGTLQDGRTVSNYHLLPPEILQSEGWLPLEEVKPETAEGEYLVHDRYEILENKVIEYFKVAEVEENGI